MTQDSSASRHSARHAIYYRPSVCPSVCQTIALVYHAKAVEVFSISPSSSPVSLVFAG